MTAATPGQAARWCGVHRTHAEHDWTSLDNETFRCAPVDETFGAIAAQDAQPAPVTAATPGQAAPKSEANWTCEFCPAKFADLAHAEQHVRIEHPGAAVEDENVFELAAILAGNPHATNPDLARIILADPRFARRHDTQPAPERQHDFSCHADDRIHAEDCECWCHDARPAPELAGCGCPEADGKIYHQRGTCTDPVVEQLGWYADSGRIAAAPEAQAAPELAAAMAALATEMHAEADRIASPNCRRADATELARAETLHEYAARIRQLLGPEAS